MANILKSSIIWLIVTTFCFGCATTNEPQIEFERLLCEYAENPISIHTYHPRFSWVVKTLAHAKNQSAYQIILSDNKNSVAHATNTLWNTGKIISNETMHLQYNGQTLKSDQNYYWKVKIWDEKGLEYTSEIQEFSTSLLRQDDWKAKWIGANSSFEPEPAKGFFMDRKEELQRNDTVVHNGRSVLLRKEFGLDRAIKSARLFITGLGFYEVEINGIKAGDQVLSPSKTPYHKYILFDTYDVTGLLNDGNNTIGIHLGNGWYNPYKKWWKEYRMQWFGYKKAIAQLRVIYEDGEQEVIVTDESWKTGYGPVLYNCVYDGEIYDANEEKIGWSKPGFNDSEWKDAVLMKAPKAKLIAQQMPPIKINEIRKPVSRTEPKPGMIVYDLGQNFTGWVQLKLKGEKGTKITIKHSEELYEDGTLNFTCNERAKATIEYTLKGGGEEVYQPSFTYFGFQFVEITSTGEMPEILDIEGHVVYSANERKGNFSCSHDLINKMHHATVWSQMSNMLSYPMDCPQRDERLGWMGDAQVTAEEAMFNFDMASFYENWFRGIRANQDETGDIPIISPRPYIKDEGIEWSSSFISMVWNHYLYFGDQKILKDNYHAMVRYMDYLDRISDNYILPKGWIGDWGSAVEGWEEGEPESTPTAYYFFNATILRKVADILNKNQDRDQFEKLARKIRHAYNRHYFDSLTHNYNDGSQMANAFPLYLGLVEEKNIEAVMENLIIDIVDKNDTHLTTGVLGTKYLIDALSMHDRSDIAWNLATQTTYPSWAEMMKRFNTMCEFWTLKQSHNHVMMGSIDAWFYKVLAGIQIDENNPAFEKFTIRPFFANDLDYVNASTSTLRGEILVNWQKTDGGYKLNAKIPFNTEAMVYLPGNQKDQLLVNGHNVENQSLIQSRGYEEGFHSLKVPSGEWKFIVRYSD